MTSKTRKNARRPADRWMGLALAAGFLTVPGLAAASSLDLFYERTVMTAADGRCGLFSAPIGSALAASQAQARGAALRAGADRSTLRSIELRARNKAAGVACDSPDIATATQRVNTAFEGYAKVLKMDYPGDMTVWKADRGSSAEFLRWRLIQDSRAGDTRVVFGLAGRTGANALLAIASFPEGEAPYAARLVMRDVDLTLGPYLDARGAAREKVPLSRRLPPETAQVAYSAEARSRAGTDLLPKDMTSGWAFRFPAQAARTLAGLDPRESVAIEFLFAGDRTQRTFIEVGDFAAGRAFLQVAAGR